VTQLRGEGTGFKPIRILPAEGLRALLYPFCSTTGCSELQITAGGYLKEHECRCRVNL